MTEDFLLLKEQILDCISILRANYDQCMEAGMQDIGSVLYNKIEDLLDKTKASTTKGAFEETIFLAKLIEKDIENWLVSLGQTTTSINWPDV